eukprot:tig00000325_g24097.t1
MCALHYSSAEPRPDRYHATFLFSCFLQREDGKPKACRHATFSRCTARHAGARAFRRRFGLVLLLDGYSHDTARAPQGDPSPRLLELETATPENRSAPAVEGGAPAPDVARLHRLSTMAFSWWTRSSANCKQVLLHGREEGAWPLERHTGSPRGSSARRPSPRAPKQAAEAPRPLRRRRRRPSRLGPPAATRGPGAPAPAAGARLRLPSLLCPLRGGTLRPCLNLPSGSVQELEPIRLSASLPSTAPRP